MPNGFKVTIGFPDEWKRFVEAHQVFFDRFINLESAFGLAFVRTVETAEPVDRVVFFMGRVCVEDFMEVLLLCGNGYGLGGMKIVRGMYERAVVARYLHLHPEETDHFLSFHWVNSYRLYSAIRDTFEKEVLTPDQVAEVKSKRAEVAEQFMVVSCEKCGTRRLNHTWSRLDIISMAKATGSLGQMIVPAYYLPLRQAHATPAAMFSRMREREGGGIDFDEGPQREVASQTLMTAHNLILNVLDLQKEHFNLDVLKDPLQTCMQDFLDTWGKSG